MSPENETALTIDTLRLKLTKFTSSLSISREAMTQCKVEVLEDYIRDCVRINLSQKIPTLEGDKVWVPASWWEHFKLRFFTGWLLRRCPVKYEVHTARLYLPNVPLPKEPCFELQFARLAKHHGLWTKEEGLL